MYSGLTWDAVYGIATTAFGSISSALAILVGVGVALLLGDLVVGLYYRKRERDREEV
jgi:hypothetical protein